MKSRSSCLLPGQRLPRLPVALPPGWLSRHSRKQAGSLGNLLSLNVNAAFCSKQSRSSTRYNEKHDGRAAAEHQKSRATRAHAAVYRASFIALLVSGTPARVPDGRPASLPPRAQARRCWGCAGSWRSSWTCRGINKTSFNGCVVEGFTRAPQAHSSCRYSHNLGHDPAWRKKLSKALRQT